MRLSISNIKDPDRIEALRACADESTNVSIEIDSTKDCFRTLFPPTPFRKSKEKKRVHTRDPSIPRDWSTKGPLLWGELHTRALSFDMKREAEERIWLREFAKRLPCGDCKRHWNESVGKVPVDLSNAQNYFAWTVERHNEVNFRLDKPSLSVEEAFAVWAKT